MFERSDRLHHRSRVSPPGLLRLGVALCACHTLCAGSASASSLDGDELRSYDAICPSPGDRAVAVEPLTRELEGWTNLICMDEVTRDFSDWYILPDGRVVAHGDADLPEPVRPMIAPALLAEIEAPAATINRDPRARRSLLLLFRVAEPDLPPVGGFGSFGCAGEAGDGGAASVTCTIDGVEVTPAEYDAHEDGYDAAVAARRAERDRLVAERAHVLLYDLVDINGWHARIDVERVNGGRSEVASWEEPGVLRIDLTRDEIDRLLATSEALVHVERQVDGLDTTVDDGTTGEDGVITAPPTSPSADEALDTNPPRPSSGGSGGGAGAALVLLACLAAFARRSSARRVLHRGRARSCPGPSR